MTTLARGIVRAYDAALHTADVQLAVSLPSLALAIPVSVAIPAADVVAGRECGVLLFSDDNPQDAAVITIHGVVGTSGGGAASGYLYKPGIAGGQTAYGGTAAGEILTLAGTIHATPGQVRISDKLNIGTLGGIADVLNVRHPGGSITATLTLAELATNATTTLAENNATFYGLYSQPGIAGTSGKTGMAVRGLNFFATCSGAGTFTEVRSIYLRSALLGSPAITDLAQIWAESILTIGFTGSATQAYGAYIGAQGFTGATNAYGARIRDPGAGTNRRGLAIDDVTGGTIAYIIEAGPATPHMRLNGSGNWAPGINTAETPLYLLAGNNDNPLTKTLRQIKWVDPGLGGINLAAGQRVMILV